MPTNPSLLPHIPSLPQRIQKLDPVCQTALVIQLCTLIFFSSFGCLSAIKASQDPLGGALAHLLMLAGLQYEARRQVTLGRNERNESNEDEQSPMNFERSVNHMLKNSMLAVPISFGIKLAGFPELATVCLAWSAIYTSCAALSELLGTPVKKSRLKHPVWAK